MAKVDFQEKNAVESESLTRYHWFLLFMLSVATFFEGFDDNIRALILPYLGKELHLDPSQLGMALTFIFIGNLVAFLVLPLGDRFGRKNTLLWTVVLYAIFTGLSAFSRSLYDFAAYQFIGKVFLMTEYGLAMVIIAEEVPARYRTFAISAMVSLTFFGGLFSALALPIMMATAMGWRSMYLLGLIPIIIIFFMRFKMHETKRFTILKEERARGIRRPEDSYWAVLTGQYRKYLILLMIIFACAQLVSYGTQSFLPLFLVNERGFTPKQVSSIYVIIILVGIVGYFVIGWLYDKLGRRWTGGIFICVFAGVAAWAYNSAGYNSLLIAFGFFAFTQAAISPLINAYAAELFPTAMRSKAQGWISNGPGRLIVVLGPTIIGFMTLSLGSIGRSFTFLAVLPVVAGLIVIFLMPETKGKTLEEITGSQIPNPELNPSV
jgi:MFS transporter, putative metabolite:H+ symporter